MKRVCLFVGNLAKQGGEERMCVTLAQMLVDAGYYVVIVEQLRPYYTPPTYKIPPKVHSKIINGCRVERFLSRKPLLKYISLLKYKLILMLYHIDVVIDVDIHASLITSKVINHKKTKLISWDHFNYERFIARPSRQPLHNIFLRHVDKLVVLTKSDLRDYIEKERLPEKMMAQIYNASPIQCDSQTTHHNSRTVLAVGRLEAQKGFDMLLKAWEIIASTHTDWNLEIVGDGCMKRELQETIKQNHLQHISLQPYTNNIREKYEQAAFLVVSSRYEGFPLTVIEAMTMSLPVVSFDIVGPNEVIDDGKNGFLVELGNIEALADKILYLMDNDQKREEVGRNAFYSSLQFRFKNISSQWVSLIESL